MYIWDFEDFVPHYIEVRDIIFPDIPLVFKGRSILFMNFKVNPYFYFGILDSIYELEKREFFICDLEVSSMNYTAFNILSSDEVEFYSEYFYSLLKESFDIGNPLGLVNRDFIEFGGYRFSDFK